MDRDRFLKATKAVSTRHLPHGMLYHTEANAVTGKHTKPKTNKQKIQTITAL